VTSATTGRVASASRRTPMRIGHDGRRIILSAWRPVGRTNIVPLAVRFMLLASVLEATIDAEGNVFFSTHGGL
jgi:hypothetical protein